MTRRTRRRLLHPGFDPIDDVGIRIRNAARASEPGSDAARHEPNFLGRLFFPL